MNKRPVRCTLNNRAFWFSLLILPVVVAKGAEPDWGRAIIDGGNTQDTPSVTSELSFLNSTDGHLVGTFRFVNGSKAPISVQGTTAPDGKFWPNVIAQITTGTTKKDWKWKTIGRSSRGDVSTVLSISPITIDESGYYRDLLVDMDVFKPFINKATYGCVVFGNGKRSMFEMKNLVPPETERLAKHDSIMSIRPNVASSATYLASLSSEDEREYRRILESKLFVTRADCARLSVRPSASPEFALSVYSRLHRRLPTRRSYYVTVTQASKSIYQSLQENEATDISVGRLDASIPADTAVALKRLWKKILSQTSGSELSMLPSSDGEIVQFSLDTWKNSVSAGELAIIAGEQTAQVQGLRDLLMKYCTAESGERAALAKTIRKNARGLSKDL